MTRYVFTARDLHSLHPAGFSRRCLPCFSPNINYFWSKTLGCCLPNKCDPDKPCDSTLQKCLDDAMKELGKELAKCAVDPNSAQCMQDRNREAQEKFIKCMEKNS